MSRVFVTGSDGFTGRHLVPHLRALGHDVIGFTEADGDIRDRAAVRTALAAAQPDRVVHLAGLLKASEPQELYAVNVNGTVALLEALVELALRPIVLVTSSSAVYGAHGAEPVSERVEPRPRTHYGASKLAQEVAALRYFDAHGLPVVRARAFNLLGPGMSPSLACAAFAERIARAERSPDPEPIRTGNLGALRDFTDIRDAVRAYALLAEHGRPGEVYNVCTQQAVSMQACLDRLLGLATRPIESTVDPDLYQPNDIAVQVGDCTKLANLTRWAPEIPLAQSLRDMLDHCRRSVA